MSAPPSPTHHRTRTRSISGSGSRLFSSIINTASSVFISPKLSSTSQRDYFDDVEEGGRAESSSAALLKIPENVKRVELKVGGMTVSSGNCADLMAFTDDAVRSVCSFDRGWIETTWNSLDADIFTCRKRSCGV